MRTTFTAEELNKELAENMSFIRKCVNDMRTVFFINHEDFEDCVQEASLAYIRALETYDASKYATFRNYASICIKNAVVNEMKKTCKINEHTCFQAEIIIDEKEGDKLDLIEALPSENKIEDEYIFSERIDEVKAAMKSVYDNGGEKLKQAVEAIGLMAEGYTGDEAAEMLGVNPDTLRVYISRAKKKIAAAYAA